MYESYYGLTGKPFQLNPDPAFYFGSRGHKRAFAYLQYGLYQSEGFIVITGEIGAGKTTIVRSLFEHIDRDKLVAAQLVSTQLDADDMLRSVGAAFGLPVKAVVGPQDGTPFQEDRDALQCDRLPYHHPAVRSLRFSSPHR